MKTYLLDTSALLAYLRDEPGAESVSDLLRKKRVTLKMHRIHLGELYYGILKKDGPELAFQTYGLLLQYPIEYLNTLDDRLLITAGQLKVDHGLGFADSFAAATAILEKAILVTKDNDFRPLAKSGLLKIHWV